MDDDAIEAAAHAIIAARRHQNEHTQADMLVGTLMRDIADDFTRIRLELTEIRRLLAAKAYSPRVASPK